jgi:hypothetical protein
MNKNLIFIIPLILWGCGHKFDTVIDSETTNYQVNNVSSFPNFIYAPGDSTIIASISFHNVTQIKSVFFNLTDPDGNIVNVSPIPLFDDGNAALHGDAVAGDGTYSNKYPFSLTDVNGEYTLQYYLEDNFGNVALAAEHNFIYNNGVADIAPVVSNLVAPDSVTLDTTATTFINISIQAADSNGLNDIELVFFNSFLPNGNPSTQNPVIMFDDGNSVHGDAVAGDGIYSQIISLPPTGVTKGTYRWEFQARDREKKTSNIIIHNIVVK